MHSSLRTPSFQKVSLVLIKMIWIERGNNNVRSQKRCHQFRWFRTRSRKRCHQFRLEKTSLKQAKHRACLDESTLLVPSFCGIHSQMPWKSLSSTLALMNLPYQYQPSVECLIDHCHQHWPHHDDQSVGWCKSTLPSLSELGVNVCRYQLSASACILYCYLHSWDCEMYFAMCIADSNCPYCEAPSIKWGGELR